nr:hypothetical protein [Tanacetum cinerariifolium]
MIVEQQVAEEGDADENVENVNAGDAAEGDVSAANDEVLTVDEEPSIPSPTPPTSPPQPSQDIPSTSQDAGILMNLYQEVMDTCIALTRRVEHLELDKISQALEITKLKRRVKKLEMRNKVNVLKVAEERMIADMDADADVVLEEAKEVTDNAKDDQDADEESEPIKVQEVVEVVTTAKLITEVVTATSTTITAAKVLVFTATTADAPTLTAAPRRRTKGVVIRDLEESTITTSIIVHFKAKSKDKGKGILVEEPKPLKKQAQIEQDKKYARELEAELNRIIDWDEVIDHKTKEKIKEEDSRALKSVNETLAEKATKRKKLDEELILLVERKYPLIRFTLDQMLNAVRLKVKEESEVSLYFGVDVAKEFKNKHAKCLVLLVKDLVLSSQVDVVD